MRIVRLLVATALAATTVGVLAPGGAEAGSASTPRWVKHVERYPGGISNGVRAYLDPAVAQAQARYGNSARHPAGGRASLHNVQMNSDTYPPMPQNETTVAYNVDNPLIAVAGANDYVTGGTLIMHTTDGGSHWQSVSVVPVFRPTSEICNGGDPAIAYSRRDSAFYLAQLCFFRTLPQSEVQVYKSLDGGATWTPGRRAAIAATNYDSSTGQTDTSVFNDKEYIAVDNNPRSPHYGRVYVTWTRFHIDATGFSDTCPIKLAYTDTIPSQDPSLTVWNHTDVVADNPNDQGVGKSANQFSVPVVESQGTLDVAYVLEECNTSIDHGLRFQKSSDGGATFLPAPVKVNKPGTWADNPDPADLIPNTAFRTPNTVSLAYSPVTGTLVFAYTNYINGQGNGDINASRSTDGGVTWSNPIVVSVGPSGNPARNNQFFPWVASDENGRFTAMWLDRRPDPNNHDITTFQASSTDDGQTWPNVRIATALWNPDNGFFTSGAFIGDYSGIAASTRVVYPVWTDGRNSAIEQTGIGETDIFTNVELAP
jgi:BNR repeat-like domain